MIEKRGNKYCLMSQTKDKKGKRKNLGCYSSKEGALKRERQVNWFKHKKDEGVMNIKKSQIYEMIKEELEVILTNDEAREMFDLDPAALLDAMMKEAVSVSTKDIVESDDIVTSSAEPGPQQRGAGRINKRPGTYQADRAATSNPGVWAQKERQEIVDRLKGIKADGQYSEEEKEQLLLVQALEGLLNDVLDIVFRDEKSYKEHRGEVTAQVIRLQQGLKRIVAKATVAEVDAVPPEVGEPRDLEEGDENWMQKAFSKKKGSLKRMLGVPKDKTISVSKMATALRAGGEEEEKARAAVNANPKKYGSIKDVGVEKKKKD